MNNDPGHEFDRLKENFDGFAFTRGYPFLILLSLGGVLAFSIMSNLFLLAYIFQPSKPGLAIALVSTTIFTGMCGITAILSCLFICQMVRKMNKGQDPAADTA